MKYVLALLMFVCTPLFAQGVRVIDLPSGSVVSSGKWVTATPTVGTVTTNDLAAYMTSTGGMVTSGAAVTAARGAIGLTTTGSGAASYSSSTGVLNVPTPATLSINDAPGRSIVTATNATGFQVSSTRNAMVCYEGTFQTTSTIGGPSSITVFLETANTNSTTPGDWTIISQQLNSNTITLAVVLQQVDIEPWGICRMIPAGKFVRIRSGSVTGTASATVNATQQETLF